jgi:DNA-binding NarL/FixJ family response regulator
MQSNLEPLNTSVLFIDDSENQRTHWIDQLTWCAPDHYRIFQASDAEAGLTLFRSEWIDCVIMELALPDQTGFKLLMDLVPMPSKPRVAVIVLTQLTHRGLWELAKEHGAYACLHKHYTSADDLDSAIRGAVVLVGNLPKEDRYRPN